MRNRPAWDFELTSQLASHRPTLDWLPDHLADLLPSQGATDHLLSMESDLCDAGHIHLDILLWVLGQGGLHSVIVSEEHFDRGPESVDTTFETSVSSHPLDTIVGTQISTASHPDGTQLDVSLAVMLNTPGHTGHADPISLSDPDVIGYALAIQPSSLSFTVGPQRTGELARFAEQILDARGGW